MPVSISANTYDKQSADTKYGWVLSKISKAKFPQDCSVDTEILDGNREIRYHLMQGGKRLTTLVVEHVPKSVDSQGNAEDIEQVETSDNVKNQDVIDKWILEVKEHFKL